MPDLRVLSYLPNPRLYKATIAARFSGAEIEVIGDKPYEMPNWLWDYDAKLLDDNGKAAHEKHVRIAKRGFQGKLYKTEAFLKANPFGDIPAAFGEGGKLGLFESNSIMRAAARVGPEAPALYGNSPLEAARIDGFLDRTLLFANDIQPYILARDNITKELHGKMADSFAGFVGGVEQALQISENIAGDALSLADVVFACELALMSTETRFMVDGLKEKGFEPILSTLKDYPFAHQHLQKLLAMKEFAEDLGGYAKYLP